jgi:type VI secretion system secreted protein Hcp
LDSGIVEFNSDPSPGFMRVEGASQGPIEGDVEIPGREGTILITELHHEIDMPFDPRTGLPAGGKQHGALTVTTVIDRATPLLYRALATGEHVETEIRLFAIDPTGVEVHYFTITLRNAWVMSMRPFIPNTLDPAKETMGHMFELSFVYESMTYVDEVTGGGPTPTPADTRIPTNTPGPTNTPTPTATATPTPAGRQGDVNCDGVVNVVDALFILQYEVGLRVDGGGCPLPPPPHELLDAAGGDVNKDGLTNVVDALFILQCEVGVKPGANMAFCAA